MAYEALNQWHYVIAAYVLGLGGTAILLGWAWSSMRRAEARREKGRGQ